MPDYAKGKIYKLCGAGKTYIGSTIRPLSARHWEHKKKGAITVQEIIADPNHQITLIELFPCSCKEELLARERYHIENTECVNKVRPIISENERKENNKIYMKTYKQTESYKEYRKEYRESNRECIKAYQKAFENTPERKEYQRQYYLRKKAEKLALQQN